MNILNKAALQGLKRNRTRTLVTIIGVVLSAAMITAVATFGVSLINYMIRGAEQKYGGWHAAFLDVDSSFAQQRAQDEEVKRAATFDTIGYAIAEGSENPEKPYFLIAGFHQDTFEALPVNLLSGRLPLTGGEAVVSGKVTKPGGGSYAVGDTLSLAVGSRAKGGREPGQTDPFAPGEETLTMREERRFTVVGVCQTPVFEQDTAPAYTLITRADASKPADVCSVFVTLNDPRGVSSYISGAADGHAALQNNAVLRFLGISDDPGDQIFNALLYAVGAIVIAIIMLGSIFLIYNAFSISLNERTRQIGILSSVGATAKQLRGSVLFEGLIIGAAGIPLGILAGIGSIGLVISVVAKNFGTILYDGVPLTLTVSAPALLTAAAVSLVTILISAYIPARKAAAMPVMDCIRQTNEVKVEAKAVKTSGLMLRLTGLEGALALKNFKRNKKRVRSIVLSLVLSVVLFVATSAFVSELKQTTEQARVVTDYDIGFGTQQMDDGELLRLYDRLSRVNGVTHASYQAFADGVCEAPAAALSDAYAQSAGGRPQEEAVTLPVGIQFLDDEAYGGLLRELGLPEPEYTGLDGRLVAVAKMQDGGHSGGVSQLPGLFTDPEVELTVRTGDGAEQAVRVTCVDAVPPDTPPVTGVFAQQPFYFQIMAPWRLQERLTPLDLRVKGMTFRSEKPAQSAAEMKAILADAGIKASYILLDTSQTMEESRNYVFIANVFAYTFIVLISLIAAANVFNTISTNIRLRRQELAMLRSVGMADREFNAMMRFECVFYGAKTLLYGLPIAAAAAWLIHRAMFIGGADAGSFTLPWVSILVSVVSVGAVIFATMMYAVSKLKKENIIDALRDEMT